MPTSSDESKQTVRDIGRWGAISTVAGSMVGVGIFFVPPLVAEKLPSVFGFSSVWLLAAVTALAGAASYAELGARMPEAGGDYVFQHEAYGGTVAFASGWLLFAGIFTGSIASLAVPLCRNQLPALLGAAGLPFDPAVEWGPMGITQGELAAIAIVVGLTVLNSVRVRVSSTVQTLTTFVPILILTAGGFVLVAWGGTGVSPPWTSGGTWSWSYVGTWFEAYGRVYFVFSGWNAVIYVAGEVEDPGETLPVGLVGGTLLVTAVYAVLCTAYVTSMGFSGLAGAADVGAGTAAARAFAGPSTGTLVAGVVAVAILASINATILAGARVCYAMARRGAMFEYFETLNVWGVPMRALWIQALGACLLVVTGTFAQILDFVVLAMMLVGILTVATLWTARRRGPANEEQSEAEGLGGLAHPWSSTLYIVSSAAVLIAGIGRAVESGTVEGWYPVFGIVGFSAVLAVGLVWERFEA